MTSSSAHASARLAYRRGTARPRTARSGGIPPMAPRRTAAASVSSACSSWDDTPTPGVKSSVSHGVGASRLGCYQFPVSQASRRNHLRRLQEAPAVVILPLVEAERLFVNVRAKVERLDGDI